MILFLFFVFVVCYLVYHLLYYNDKVKMIEYLERKYDKEFYGLNFLGFEGLGEYYFTDNNLVLSGDGKRDSERVTVFKTKEKGIYHDNYFYFLIRDKLISDIKTIVDSYNIKSDVVVSCPGIAFDDSFVSVIDYDKFLLSDNSDMYITVTLNFFVDSMSDIDPLVECFIEDLSKAISGGLFKCVFYCNTLFLKTVEIQGCKYNFVKL